MPPVAPMLAKAADELPEGDGWIYEPKWDGFRCIVFRDGDEVELGSRNERPLHAVLPRGRRRGQAQACPSGASSTARSLIPGETGLDFDALLQRIHPADSRVRKLAAETPASFVAFDLLAVGDRDLMDQPAVRAPSDCSNRSRRRARRSSSRRSRPTSRRRRTGSVVSRARASTVSSRSAPIFRTARTSA